MRDVIQFLLYLSESFQTLAETKNIKLTTYTEVDQLLMDFDEDKLQQIIANLLSNAVKFTNADGKVVFHITQINEGNTSFLQIKVKDNGIGIPSDKISQIFDRFYQVDDSSLSIREGTGIALKEIPDIIISDVMMPKKDGYEVCETLKTDERSSHIPIVLLTAKSTNQDKIDGLSHSADAYLTKPFNKVELLTRLERLVALRKLLQSRYGDLNSTNKKNFSIA